MKSYFGKLKLLADYKGMCSYWLIFLVVVICESEMSHCV